MARFIDDATRRPMIVASGIGEGGAFAAAEFLTDASHVEELVKQAPKDWNQKNIMPDGLIVDFREADNEFGRQLN